MADEALSYSQSLCKMIGMAAPLSFPRASERAHACGTANFANFGAHLARTRARGTANLANFRGMTA